MTEQDSTAEPGAGSLPGSSGKRSGKTIPRREPFVIADREVAPGERLQFELRAASLYTNTPLNMMVEVIHGRRPGPVLLVCAAIHGDELNGVEIIRRLRGMRGLRQLRGTLVLVPVVNIFGFIHQSRYLPDRRDLNRCFPGREKGSIASRVAHLFFDEVVSKCTHIVDLHTAAVNRNNLPQIRAALGEDGVAEMAQGFRIPVIVNSGLIENSLREQAGKLGIPVITYESGEALRLDESCIVTGVRGVVSVMRTLHMLATRRLATVRAEPYIATSTYWVRAPVDGMFRPLAKLGMRVTEGDAIGIIAAPFAGVEEVLRAPSDGIVICFGTLPLVNEGEALFHIAEFEKAEVVQDEIAAHESNIEDDRLFEMEATIPPPEVPPLKEN